MEYLRIRLTEFFYFEYRSKLVTLRPSTRVPLPRHKYKSKYRAGVQVYRVSKSSKYRENRVSIESRSRST